MDKADTRYFTDDKGSIQPSKLGRLIIERRNIVHIKSTPTMNNIDALSTPLYGYNAKYGVYEGLTTRGRTPLEKIIYDYVGDLEISSNKMNDTIRYINANANVLPFIDTNIIAFRNTLYDVCNDEAIQKDPSIVTTTRMTSVEYNPDIVEHDQLDTFMFNLFGGQDDDKDMMRFIYEVIGYCLVNNTFAQKFFILYGEGGNGKSSFLQLLTSLLTEVNVSNIALIDIDGSKFRLAEIMGKFANIGDDIDNGSILSTANIKKIVTGDTIVIENKGCKPYSYNPHAKLFFSCNSIPRIYDTSTGMQDRLVVIPMTNRIRNTSLASPYIVQEIVNSNGLTVLLNRADNGEVQITPVYGSTLGYDAEINILQSTKDVFARDLYLIYQNWAKESGYKSLGKHEFGKRMKALGYTNTKNIRGMASTEPYKAWQLVTEK